MSLTASQKWLATINALYIAGFAIYYLSIRNYEFLWYVLVTSAIIGLILLTLPRTKFDNLILGGLSLWGLMHMAGGGVRLGGQVLYKLPILHLFGSGESLVLKFDQLVHFFGFAVATLVFYHLLRPYLSTTINWRVLFPLIVLGGMGLGAFNEMIEFAAVVMLDQTGVGGYWNTSLDLVFNFIGALAAAVVINYRYRYARTSADLRGQQSFGSQ
ncbi:MAG: DUF2238 domain-containing protein [Patescibacteria group bacterium]